MDLASFKFEGGAIRMIVHLLLNNFLEYCLKLTSKL